MKKRKRSQVTLNSVIVLLLIISTTELFAQVDTVFLDKHTAIVKLRDAEYEDFDKVVSLKKIDTIWVAQSDTIFFDDGNVFRLRKYFYQSLPITVDSFYQHPYSDKKTSITSIVIGVGNIFFVQSFGADSKIKSVSIQKRYDKRKEIYLSNLLNTKPGGELNFSGINIKLDYQYFIEKIIFSRKYKNDIFNVKIKKPFVIFFSKEKIPEIKSIY
jgi:hypothetical protein